MQKLFETPRFSNQGTWSGLPRIRHGEDVYLLQDHHWLYLYPAELPHVYHTKGNLVGNIAIQFGHCQTRETIAGAPPDTPVSQQ